MRKAIVAICTGRSLAVDDLRAALADSNDPAVLEAVLHKAAVASVAEILAILRA